MRLLVYHFLSIISLLCCATCTKLPDGHLQPIGNSGPNFPIEQFQGFPKPELFVGKYMREKKPLVMRGALKDSPAFQKWNDAYLRSKTPKGKEGNVFIEYGKKENRSDPSADIHFLKFLDQYNTSDMYMVHHVPNFLAPDVIMPFCIQCDAFNKNFADTVMWFSSGGTKSVFHNDGFENINCLYRGEKHLVMANVSKYSDIVPKILDVKSGSHSSADVEKIDLFKYPFFIGMEFHIADMKPGDCLYIPLGWFHHVSSVGSNLAVNVWMQKTKVDPKKCRKSPDNTLTLNKFTFSEKEDPEEVAPPKQKQGNPSSTGLLLENLAYHVLGEDGGSASLKTFMSKLSEGKKLDDKNKKLLGSLFKVLDRNKNGKWSEDDMTSRFPTKTERLIENAILKWQRIAKQLGLTYDLTGQGDGSEAEGEGDGEDGPVNDADKEILPQSDPTVYTTISDKDEL